MSADPMYVQDLDRAVEALVDGVEKIASTTTTGIGVDDLVDELSEVKDRIQSLVDRYRDAASAVEIRGGR